VGSAYTSIVTDLSRKVIVFANGQRAFQIRTRHAYDPARSVARVLPAKKNRPDINQARPGGNSASMHQVIPTI
jgi:hypothetical protein